MNERIKQLAIQVKDWAYAEHDGYTAQMLFEQKFAELIIRECINKIETYQIPVGNSAAGEMACKWTYDALKEIRDEIKEHFGVKE
jgi:hypothetical protein